jgi:hypothetical protein
MHDSAKGLPGSAVVAGVGLAVLAWLAAVWLVYTGWRLASPDHALVAVGLLLAGTVLAGVVMLTRKTAPSRTAETDIAIVFEDLHRLETSLRVARAARGIMSILCAAVVLYWIVEAYGMANLRALLIPSTILVAVTTWFYLPWIATRERRLLEERAATLQRLAALKHRLR